MSTPIRIAAAETTSSEPLGQATAVDPVGVLRDSWKLLVVVAVVGGLAGGVFAQLRSPPFEGECIVSVGVVPSDPTRPSDRMIPLRSTDEVLAWLRAKPTLERFAGSLKPLSFEVEPEGQGLVHLRLVGSEEAEVKKVLDGLVSTIEADHRALLDEWKKNAAEYAKRTNEQATTLGTVVAGANATAQDRGLFIEASTRAAASVLSQSALYTHPTARLGPAWVTQKSHGTAKLGVAGALAGLIVAWIVAHLLAVLRRPAV